MVDAFFLIVIGFFGLLVLIAVFVGRMLDPAFKVKIMRQFLHQNTIMLALITKDRKTVDRISINIDNARVKVGNSIIAVDKTRIYREDKPQAGFTFTKEHIKYDEGVPTLYVYMDSLKPADFFTEPSNVSAEDVGTLLISFVRIELMKNMEAMKRYEMLLIAILIVGGLAFATAGYGAFISMQAQNSASLCVSNTNLIMTHFGISNSTEVAQNSGVIDGDTIIIKGK